MYGKLTKFAPTIMTWLRCRDGTYLLQLSCTAVVLAHGFQLWAKQKFNQKAHGSGKLYDSAVHFQNANSRNTRRGTTTCCIRESPRDWELRWPSRIAWLCNYARSSIAYPAVDRQCVCEEWSVHIFISPNDLFESARVRSPADECL